MHILNVVFCVCFCSLQAVGETGVWVGLVRGCLGVWSRPDCPCCRSGWLCMGQHWDACCTLASAASVCWLFLEQLFSQRKPWCVSSKRTWGENHTHSEPLLHTQWTIATHTVNHCYIHNEPLLLKWDERTLWHYFSVHWRVWCGGGGGGGGGIECFCFLFLRVLCGYFLCSVWMY